MRVGLVVKPLTSGWALRRTMPARSAPSAKILILSDSGLVMAGSVPRGPRFSRRRFCEASLNGAQNPVDHRLPPRRGEVGGDPAAVLAVAVVQQRRAAAGPLPGHDVLPAVAHQEAR